MIRHARLWVTRFASLIFFFAVAGRLGYLQIYCHASLQQQVDRERSRKSRLVPVDPRGAILDRKGAFLAMSIQGGACFADPKRVLRPVETAKQLAPILQEPASMVLQKLTLKKRFVWLARRLDPETANRLREMKLPGVTVTTEMKRFYPEESLAAPVLGIVGDKQEGLSGVELMADRWLRGSSVPNLFTDWTFSKKVSTSFEEKPDLPAHSVVLTIDRNLQTIVEQELAVQMKLSRPKSGTVIIQDPYSGEILAMASAPSFDPNLWGSPMHPDTYTSETLKNAAVEHVFEPGSTFKLVTASAALEEHKVSMNDSFFCENGKWDIPGRTIHDHEKDGWLTLTQVISHSSNIGTAKMARKLGANPLYRYARAFGFGIPSGCGLPGDGAGILRQTKEWHPTSLETVAFGQEVAATSIQLVNAYSAIANGGALLEPRLYKGVIDEDGQYREWISGATIRRVVSQQTATQMKAILKSVVEDGTGKSAKVEGLSVAGKTGTSQKIDPRTRQYSESLYVASFCGFAPADHPKIVIGVFLDEPKGSYWGGSEAAPLFARILKHAAPYLKIPTTGISKIATARIIGRRS